MTWEKFTNKMGYAKEPSISIRKSGSIGISSSAMDKYFEDIDYADMYFDNKNNRLGIKPRDEEGANSYALKSVSGSKSGRITCMSFMSTYDLIPDENNKYRAKWDDDNGLVYAELDNPLE